MSENALSSSDLYADNKIYILLYGLIISILMFYTAVLLTSIKVFNDLLSHIYVHVYRRWLVFKSHDKYLVSSIQYTYIVSDIVSRM